jgi:hypothetical protein
MRDLGDLKKRRGKYHQTPNPLYLFPLLSGSRCGTRE